MANIIEQTQQAALEAEKRVNASKRLAKDVLEDFMNLFAGMAATHQPMPPGMPVPAGRLPDEAKFEKWARLAVETAGKLGPFQSPTFKAIAVVAPPPDVPRKGDEDGKIIQLNDPIAMSRVYQRRIQGVRG